MKEINFTSKISSSGSPDSDEIFFCGDDWIWVNETHVGSKTQERASEANASKTTMRATMATTGRPRGPRTVRSGPRRFGYARMLANRSSSETSAAAQQKKILMLGGTRFIGVYLARLLVDQGHEVTLMTRGKSPITTKIPDDTDEYYASYSEAVRHIACDRKDLEAVESKLKNESFDVVYDINAREKEDILPVLSSLPNLDQYILCSSAG